jgi:hypothetical protein
LKPALTIVPLDPHFIEIDKGIPIPTGRCQSRYPFAQMKVGDSFFVETNRSSAAKSAIKDRRRRFPNERYVSRKKPTGTRIWRVA